MVARVDGCETWLSEASSGRWVRCRSHVFRSLQATRATVNRHEGARAIIHLPDVEPPIQVRQATDGPQV